MAAPSRFRKQLITVGECVEAGDRIIANCQACGDKSPVDLEKLVILGLHNHRVSAVAGSLRCASCASRHVDIYWGQGEV